MLRRRHYADITPAAAMPSRRAMPPCADAAILHSAQQRERKAPLRRAIDAFALFDERASA